MPEHKKNLKIIHFPSVSTTMDTALKYLELAEDNPVLLLADQQTASKGRGENIWISPLDGFWGTFIYALEQKMDEKQLAVTHLACALAAKNALAKQITDPILLKWPNDLVIKGKKFGGILLVLISGEKSYLLTGVGINTNCKLTQFPDSLQSEITTLVHEQSSSINHRQLANQFNELFEKRLVAINAQDFGSILEEFEQVCFQLRKPLYIKGTDFRCDGISKEGKLIIKSKTESKAIPIVDSFNLQYITE